MTHPHPLLALGWVWYCLLAYSLSHLTAAFMLSLPLEASHCLFSLWNLSSLCTALVSFLPCPLALLYSLPHPQKQLVLPMLLQPLAWLTMSSLLAFFTLTHLCRELTHLSSCHPLPLTHQPPLPLLLLLFFIIPTSLFLFLHCLPSPPSSQLPLITLLSNSPATPVCPSPSHTFLSHSYSLFLLHPFPLFPLPSPVPYSPIPCCSVNCLAEMKIFPPLAAALKSEVGGSLCIEVQPGLQIKLQAARAPQWDSISKNQNTKWNKQQNKNERKKEKHWYSKEMLVSVNPSNYGNMVSKRWRFPWASHAGRRKGSSHRGRLFPGKSSHTALATCQTTYRLKLEATLGCFKGGQGHSLTGQLRCTNPWFLLEP